MYGYTLCRRTTKFDAVTHYGKRAYLFLVGQPRSRLKQEELQRFPILGFVCLWLHSLKKNDQTGRGNIWEEGLVFRWSATTRDIAIFTIERRLEVICVLSNDDIFNDLDGPLTRFSRSRHFWSWIFKKKRCILGTKLLKNTNRKPYPIYRMISLSMTFSDPNFKVTTFFEV